MATIGALVEICSARGISCDHLHEHVLSITTFETPKADPAYTYSVNRAIKAYNAGLAAQLSILRIGWGEKKLRNILADTGGVLDAIVMHTALTPEELADETGWDRVDDNCNPS